MLRSMVLDWLRNPKDLDAPVFLSDFKHVLDKCALALFFMAGRIDKYTTDTGRMCCSSSVPYISSGQMV